MNALGMIEVYGYLAAVEALDSALKAANVSRKDVVIVKGGLVTVLVEGDVGAVKAAMDASSAAAERVGQVVSVHVIPRPASDVDKMLTPKGPEPTPPAGGPTPPDSEPENEDAKELTSEPEEDVSEAAADVLEEDSEREPQEQQEAVTEESLEKLTVDALRRKARELEVTNMTRQEIRFAKRRELIQKILEFVGQER